MRLRHLLLQGTRPVFWVLLRVLPPRRYAVVHGWPTLEGNVVELLPDLTRRYSGPVHWLVDGDPSVALRHLQDKGLAPQVRVVPKASVRAVWLATTAEVTFFTHGLFSAVVPPPSRLVVNLWHGDGPKANDHAGDIRSTVVVTGTRMWQRYKAETFNVRERDVAWTGNPRGNALLRGLSREQWQRLGLDPDDTLVLWLPTFRVGRNEEGLVWQDGVPLSGRGDLHDLREVATRPRLSLVVKPHPMDRDDYSQLGIRVLTDDDLRDAGVALYELLGSSAAVISDTSSAWVDYLPLDRPVAFFLPDIDELASHRGFNVPDLRAILPGPVLRDVADVRAFLEAVVQDGGAAAREYATERDRVGAAPLGNAADRLLDWLDDYQRSRGRTTLFGADAAGRLREQGSMKVAISCPFNENAVWALSRTASADARLVERLTPRWDLTGRTADRLARALRRPAGLTRFAERKTAKAAASRLPEDVPVSVLTEVVRLAGAGYRTPLTPLLGHYAWKAQFDRRASRALDSSGIDVLIGMPGSCLRTFQRHDRPLRVFHAIDTHPRARNAALRETYGRRARREIYPDVLTRRIEEELASADVVLVPSRLVEDGMVRAGVDPGKIRLVPYGVDLRGFSVRPEVVTAPSDGRPRLIFVGQICLRKGVPLLIDAVRGQDVHLSLAGQVFDRSIVADLPGNVSLLGVLTPSELAHVYNEHDAMVLPTVDDACSLVVAEAAACGLRVVTTSANGAAELLPPGHVVVPPRDVAALREVVGSLAVLDLADREELSRAIRSASDRRIRSWDDYANEVYAVLGERLAAPAPIGRAVTAPGSRPVR